MGVKLIGLTVAESLGWSIVRIVLLSEGLGRSIVRIILLSESLGWSIVRVVLLTVRVTQAQWLCGKIIILHWRAGRYL